MLVPAGNDLNLIYFVASFSVPTQFIVKGYMKTRKIYTSLERWSDLFGKPVGVKNLTLNSNFSVFNELSCKLLPESKIRKIFIFSKGSALQSAV